MGRIVEKRRTERYCQSADGAAMFRRFAEPARRFGVLPNRH
jgi:hypothetical protein